MRSQLIFLFAFLLSFANETFSGELAETIAPLLAEEKYEDALTFCDKESVQKDQAEEIRKILNEIINREKFVTLSFLKEAGQEADIIINGKPRKITILEAKDGNLYFQELAGKAKVKSAVPFSAISDRDIIKRLGGMDVKARAVYEGVKAFQSQSFSRALLCFKDAGILSSPLTKLSEKQLKQYTDFLDSIKKGDIETVSEIIKSGKLKINMPLTFMLESAKNSSSPQEFRTSFLLEAISAKQDDIARVLVENGADLNFPNSNGVTPLMLCVMKLNSADRSLLEYLISKGADLNAKDSSGDTALTGAISLKRFPAARLLIEKGANVNSKNIRGYTPLMLAVFSDDPGTVKLLLDKGADVTAKHREGWSLLNINHDKRNPEIRKMLEPYLEKNKPKPVKYDYGGGIKNF